MNNLKELFCPDDYKICKAYAKDLFPKLILFILLTFF